MNAGSTGSHSLAGNTLYQAVSSPQAGSASPQLGKNAGKAGAQFQAVSASPGHLMLVSPRQVPPRPPRHSPTHREDNTLENPKIKWVIYLSSKPLTQAQRSLLAKGPNFAVTLWHLPNLEYITAIQSVCSKLGQQDAEELRANIKRLLRSSHPKLNLTKAQTQAFRELKRARDKLVLTANKGVAMVIMDRQDNVNKSNQLLSQPAYRSIHRDPTNKIKTKLINILKG